MGALSHLRVLDLSRVLAGPWASQLLGDLGAEIIKIENPNGGDDTRAWGPPYAKTPEGADSDVAAYFLAANRNKKSVALDISKPEGQEIVRKLAACSDVLIENFKVGGLAKYGLDYASLSQVNPRLVYCSITGFGQTGPYAKRPGYDFLIQGLGGLMSLTGHPDGAPGGGPMKVGVALTDVLTGLYASNAILAALAWRERSGKGQHIDLALLDVQVACLANRSLNQLVGSPGAGRLGNAHPSIVPYQDFPTADGHMILAVGNDGQFARFCAEAGAADLAADPRYATNAARVANRDELVEKLRALTVTRTTKDWIATLEQAGVPCGPINELRDVFADPQAQAREMARELPHERLGSVPTVANPIRLSETPAAYRSAPPDLGAHTREVLAGLGVVAEADMDDLEARGVVGRRA
ncbi:crotonobetainyl-CoA:carnitine CoA-transferase CaiB-like acyl-CoA transferase [Rhodoblastus acidophilus]|uniref:CaiB/BaiF CoA transferase family protein n=1 Tax=Rhodoblastus acidophilus TaxID=1074 RepID=UPI0022255CB5|nr:CaiB/BaiF CoA-transferase family protein [Rhodoblastus acidophilus]MCW2316687.1 crotonobetainyl-CoA:carnitine CoA-transferase CaiB-like acyl-CoA transferase [Rhodoblastus acidophilus]